jgi:diguanylate cyclase (GGDEF)-like protein
MVGFAAAPLKAMLENVLAGSGGYVELRQITGKTAVTVSAWGTASHAEPLLAVPANQGHWSLVHRSAGPPPLRAGGWLYSFHLSLLAIALAGFAATAFRLHRRTVRAVRHDVKSLARMFRDVREGNVRVDYPMRLEEFAEAFRYLRESGERLLKERERLKDMGLIDHLSQLSNRRHFEMRLKELFDIARSHGPSSVLIIDVDHFKSVNDRHGHDIGDALIVGFADALRKMVRQTDVLARLGGDEFCIIYPYAPLEKAQAFAERLRRQLPREIPLGKGVIHGLRWTGGLSVMTDKDKKFDEVLWRADQALIAAKEAGRNLTMVFDPKTGGVVKQRIIPS